MLKLFFTFRMKSQIQILFIGLVLVLVSCKAYSQIFKGEIIGGLNKSQVDGDYQYGFKKNGLVTGVGIVAPVYKNWSLSLETLYSQKGSKLKAQSADSLDGSYKLILNYVEVPFMIQYTDKDNVSAGIGVSWNRLVFAEEYRDGYKVDSVSVETKIFNPDDWMAFADVRVRVYKNLLVNARYSYSMSKIATRYMPDLNNHYSERDFYNSVWSFRLIYMINEKRSDKNEPRKAPINE